MSQDLKTLLQVCKITKNLNPKHFQMESFWSLKSHEVLNILKKNVIVHGV